LKNWVLIGLVVVALLLTLGIGLLWQKMNAPSVTMALSVEEEKEEKTSYARADPNEPAATVERALRLTKRGQELDSKREFEEAEKLHRQALEIYEKAYGKDHPEVAACLNNLAISQMAQGKNDSAENLLLRALEIKVRTFGPDNLEVATTLNNLAMAYSNQRKVQLAESAYLRAIAIWERTYGPEHPHIAACLSNYADLLMDVGRETEARRLRARASRIQSKQERGAEGRGGASLN